MPGRVLTDSSFLYALFDHSDQHHAAAKATSDAEAGVAVVPDIVLVEVAFLARRAGGNPAVLRFLGAFCQSGLSLEAITLDDLKRVRDISIFRPIHCDYLELLP